MTARARPTWECTCGTLNEDIPEAEHCWRCSRSRNVKWFAYCSTCKRLALDLPPVLAYICAHKLTVRGKVLKRRLKVRPYRARELQ